MSLIDVDQLVDEVRAWEDDPGSPPSKRTPILGPRPDLGRAPLPVGIAGTMPTDTSDQPGTEEFRYWNLAVALRRAADFWGAIVPSGTSWYPTVGPALRANLDGGDDLNAFYDRRGVDFFHSTVDGVTVYSGESPDVVCHETGHAVLDALQPQLWWAQSAEIAAFHESFGDISAILSNLQVDSLRSEVITETKGQLSRSSQLSRMAEQLGWAIRQVAPTAVDRDCLRDAANQFFYRDPVTLPPQAPAVALSSEPHSFSRVFTGAFLHCLAAAFRHQPTRDTNTFRQTGIDVGRLIVAAAVAAPVVPNYYAQIAAHMIAADQELFGGRYGRSLRAGFVQHGILSPAAAAGLTASAVAPHAAAIAGAVPGEQGPLNAITVPGERYGIAEAFAVAAPGDQPRFAVTGAAPDVDALPPTDRERAALSFVEDLFRQGRVAVPAEHLTEATIVAEDTRRRTHEIVRTERGLELTRRSFD
jgi:hypothetical protein